MWAGCVVAESQHSALQFSHQWHQCWTLQPASDLAKSASSPWQPQAWRMKPCWHNLRCNQSEPSSETHSWWVCTALMSIWYTQGITSIDLSSVGFWSSKAFTERNAQLGLNFRVLPSHKHMRHFWIMRYWFVESWSLIMRLLEMWLLN